MCAKHVGRFCRYNSSRLTYYSAATFSHPPKLYRQIIFSAEISWFLNAIDRTSIKFIFQLIIDKLTEVINILDCHRKASHACSNIRSSLHKQLSTWPVKNWDIKELDKAKLDQHSHNPASPEVMSWLVCVRWQSDSSGARPRCYLCRPGQWWSGACSDSVAKGWLQRWFDWLSQQS